MKTRKIPMRRCVACMERKPKKELIRIVYTPSGELLVDITGKLNGRGLYLCPDKNCVEKAKKKNALPRGLERNISNQELEKVFEELSNSL